MKIGLMYEIEMPKPWHEGQEAEKFRQVLDQIQLADEAGFSHVFAVEHHGLEELSHCSSPELVFAAASQRTRQIRFGHGAILLPQPYNHPIRVAERISTLDILSGGRLDVGFARSVTLTEMGGFAIDPTGAYLFAANQDSGTVVLFRIDQTTGRLRPTNLTMQVGAPVCVTFLGVK